MFTFLHAADLHLDSPLVGLSKHAEAPVDALKQATRDALKNLVDLALEQQVAFLLLAGDLYDGSWRDFSTGLFFIKEMRRLREADIPVYLISGNHDAESQLTSNLTLPENVHHFGSRKATSRPHPALPVSIHGQSFATPSVRENLAAAYPPPVDGHFNIGLLHTNLGDAEGHGNYAPSTLGQLVSHGYDYWALGHIHQRQIHHEHPHVVYPGNTQGRHIRETGAKGCYRVTVSDHLTVESCQFEPLDRVRWAELTIDCSPFHNEGDFLAALREEFQDSLTLHEDRLLCVRVTLTGPCALQEKWHADPGRLQAECLSLAEDISGESLWLEQVKLRTQSLLDPAQLAQQDDLTAMVLAALEDFQPGELPAAVLELKEKLPPAAREALAPQWQAEQSEAEEIRSEVAALVLQALATADSN
ncbi:metallophosphoesterase family protein [Roseibacillus ishigakijimensis]|uniref:DNA repair exonuclease n=1 Tax=Roseibacillus ishigakijimensis TaxID=454146 RepID=A0A934RNF2_9BACT|nr:DNA repair exonuclease [Roseibacillus ishigakijimensis]MBK1832601.1 DNA repair exonuclease [Roseibacillus ishigakijimensis]